MLFDSSYWFFDLQPKFSLPTEHLKRSLISLPKGRTKNILSYLNEKERRVEKDPNEEGKPHAPLCIDMEPHTACIVIPMLADGTRVGFLFSTTIFVLLKTRFKNDNEVFIILPPHSWLELRTVVFTHLQPTCVFALFLACAPVTEQTRVWGQGE